jgi:hypothetical protein
VSDQALGQIQGRDVEAQLVVEIGVSARDVRAVIRDAGVEEVGRDARGV